jgi:hypothetical protein
MHIMNLRATVSCVRVLHSVYPSGMRTVQARAVIPVLPAVLTTFLSTLLCVLHCHTTVLQTSTPPQAAIVSPGSHALFICHSPGGETPAVPLPINSDALRALYEPAPADGSLFLTPTHTTTLPLLVALPPAAPQTTPAPDPPPPRILPA